MKPMIRGLLAIVAVCSFAFISVAEAQVTYTVGGAVASSGGLSGLASGKFLTLLKNGADSLTLTADGDFTFPAPLSSDASYQVTVAIQPAGQVCSVSNGSGSINGANVTNVSVTCVNTYTVGGSITGLAASGLVLKLNATNLIVANGATSFKFATALTSGGSYVVNVGIQPVGYTCSVSGGTGNISSANITNVAVTCARSYTVGGTITGLTSSGLILKLNGGANKIIASNATSFTFATALTSGTEYTVAVQTQPAGLTCSVGNNLGNIGAANVVNANVICVPTTYTVGGNVFGLSGSVTLLNNGGNPVTLNASGAFTFSTGLAPGASYAVTVDTQPAGQTCLVSFGSGSNINANVWGVIVTCSATGATYALSGALSNGMASSTIPLTNTRNDGSEILNVVTNGTANSYPFTFVTRQASGGTYNVTAGTAGMSTCYVANGKGVVTTANISGLVVACATQAASTYTIGGTVSGLAGAMQLSLGGSQTVNLIAGATGFTFPAPLPASSTTVSVLTQPTGQTCSIANGAVTITNANITNVVVTCVSNASTYTVGGSVTGLGSGKTLLLKNTGGISLTLNANGNFTFGTRVAMGDSYAVTVGTQPIGQICTVINGNGVITGANVVIVRVSCVNDATTYTIGGAVSGLTSGKTVTLLNNGGDVLNVAANGGFVFTTPLASGSNYNVTISAQPAGQMCFLVNNSGTNLTANVTNVAVLCTTNTFTIGGTISGLTSSGLVLQYDKGAFQQTLPVSSGATSFSFQTSLATGDLYTVLLSAQPTGLTCSVTNASGVIGSSNVTGIAVTCAQGGATYNVILGRPTDTSVTASILAATGSSAYLEYGTSSAQTGFYSGMSATVSPPVTQTTNPVIEVQVTGLTPNTKYFYRVNYRATSGSGYVAGNEYSFYTQRAPGSTFSFGVQGDSHPERTNQMFNADLYKLTMAEVAKRQPDMYFMLGDDFSIENKIATFKTAYINQFGLAAAYGFTYAKEGWLNPNSLALYNSLNTKFVQTDIGESTGGSGQYLGQRQNYLNMMAHSTHLFMVNGNHEQAHYANLGGIFNNAAVWAASARNKFYPEPTPTVGGFYTGDLETFNTGAPALNGYPGVEGDGMLRDSYAFTWGDALFVTIDPYWHSQEPVDTGLFSDPPTTWGSTMGDAQYQWLKTTLENSTAKYKFIFAHHVNGTGRGAAGDVGLQEWGGNATGGFSANRPTWAKPVHQLLVDTKDPTGATIFFQGHDHMYSREMVDGVVYQETPNPADNSYWAYNCSAYNPTSITAPISVGGKNYGSYNPNYSVKFPDTGFLHVTVSPQMVRVQYIRTYRSVDLIANANAALYDSLAGKANGEVAFSYSLPAQPGDDQASNFPYACKGDAPPTGFIYN